MYLSAEVASSLWATLLLLELLPVVETLVEERNLSAS
jgi:hypothetical protein